jgi:hypothetical protein
MSKATPSGGETQEITGVDDRTDGEDENVTTDDAFELLSNHRRRFALHHLKYNGPSAELGELADQIASWETGQPVPGVGSDERKRVYTSLQQFHLPKLEENGIIEYDDRAGTVELTESAEDLDVYLEVVQGRDSPWSQYYLWLAGVNAGLIAAVFAGAWPLTVLPDIAWAVFVVVTFVISALFHLYHTSEMRLGSAEEPPELRD